MFYLLYLYYADIAHQYPLLNLVQYQTVRMALALATAMIVAVAMGSRFINWIRAKQGRASRSATTARCPTCPRSAPRPWAV